MKRKKLTTEEMLGILKEYSRIEPSANALIAEIKFQKTFKISGSSDDLVCVEGSKEEEYSVGSCDGIHAGTLTLVDSVAEQDSLVIHCIYDGFWAFAIGTHEGDYDEFPTWNICRSRADPSYSELIEISCPATVEIKFFKPGEA